ncbi:hypothetical protein P691DRAFT_781489 [Macrolepiota fuliginosa MF-IS2]|uniref:Uncharacterized protein n=1 Tax=Macrolepiota fuliginosa MF-IS2 TaxID=1400762 RepID=A0A9P5XEL8_9AGAR|nr:hypothetical protein P691DRAFT_781489 [Macrolepiota fuliginosa MF-IS2]
MWAQAFSDLQTYKTQINNENVLLLDTSGIASPSDLERVSGLLLQWLKEQAKQALRGKMVFGHQSKCLPGWNYLRPPHQSATRAGDGPMNALDQAVQQASGQLERYQRQKNLNMYKCVVPTTTMWDEVSTGGDYAAEGGKAILEENWSIMEITGSCIAHFGNTTKSAQVTNH